MKTIIPSKERQHHIVETIRNIENKIENEEKYAYLLVKPEAILAPSFVYINI